MLEEGGLSLGILVVSLSFRAEKHEMLFNPPNLHDELVVALKHWDKFGWDAPDGIPIPGEWDDGENQNTEISRQTPITLNLPGTEETFDMTCGHFIELMSEFATARLLDNRECRTSQRFQMSVVPENNTAIQLLFNSIPEAETPEEESTRAAIIEQQGKVVDLHKRLHHDRQDEESLYDEYQEALEVLRQLRKGFEKPSRRFCALQIEIKGQPVTVCLLAGLSMFGLTAIAEGFYSEYNPHFSDDEALVEVRCSSSIEEQECRGIVAAYLFELATSNGAEFRIERRHVVEDISDEIYAPRVFNRLRPLMTGRGIGEVCNLYNQVIAASDPEFQILYATKVIEYVAQTVVRQKSYESLKLKLMSPNALSPDAQFLSELQAIAQKNARTAEDDREAIKQTIVTCCDASELARRAPKFLKEFHAKTFTTDATTQRAALAKLASVLYSTRNSIAHAKANYAATGQECPPEFLAAFAECAKATAQQAVRWFYTVSEENRIVGG